MSGSDESLEENTGGLGERESGVCGGGIRVVRKGSGKRKGKIPERRMSVMCFRNSKTVSVAGVG